MTMRACTTSVYIRCRQSNKPITLNQTCRQFYPHTQTTHVMFIWLVQQRAFALHTHTHGEKKRTIRAQVNESVRFVFDACKTCGGHIFI